MPDRATLTSGQSAHRHPRRVFVLGATGTIGRATVDALLDSGQQVVCLVRRRAGMEQTLASLKGATIRFGDPTDAASLAHNGLCGEPFDAVISCMASRTGVPKDAWAIDHQANLNALSVAKAAGIPQFILLSAICVQKPLLAFQHAKLAFEKALIDSGLNYSIVRPTAFFKSLSGQVERVKRGKPYLMFGDGQLTACKPISDRDLGRYIAECLDDESRWNRILPIGGPGEPITPQQQGECIFALLGQPPRFKRVPVKLLDIIILVLATLGRLAPALGAKAELARIGRYYATESMLVLNPATGSYDAQATPSTGSETLFDFYARMIQDDVRIDRGDHAVF